MEPNSLDTPEPTTNYPIWIESFGEIPFKSGMQKNNSQPIILTLEDISKGPEFAEDLLKGANSPFSAPIDDQVVFTGKEKNAVQAFYSAFFFDEQAKNEKSENSQNRLIALALEKYSLFLATKTTQIEALYYAQLRIGHIMTALDYKWSKIEECFLKAFETLPERGEAIEAIQLHYLTEQNFPIAYIYTSYSYLEYYSKMPKSQTWGFNERFYRWKVLEHHIAASFNLGIRDQAKALFSQLLDCSKRTPQLFTPEEIQDIHSKSKLFKEAALQ